MTDDKKHEDKDRKKVSDEELEDVAGGADAQSLISRKGFKPGSIAKIDGESKDSNHDK